MEMTVILAHLHLTTQLSSTLTQLPTGYPDHGLRKRWGPTTSVASSIIDALGQLLRILGQLLEFIGFDYPANA